MLRLLFRLWWLQQRRSFTWKDAVVGGYLIFVYVMVGLGFYFGATLDGEELFEDGTPDALCAILVLTMLVPDIILKVVMKHDSTAMDDYLKSRPVPEKVWNRFLLLTNLANFWNYVMPVLMLPMLFWMLSVPQALAVGLDRYGSHPYCLSCMFRLDAGILDQHRYGCMGCAHHHRLAFLSL